MTSEQLQSWNEFAAWYDGRPSYDGPATDTDRALILIAAAGPDNWPANEVKAVRLMSQYSGKGER